MKRYFLRMALAAIVGLVSVSQAHAYCAQSFYNQLSSYCGGSSCTRAETPWWISYYHKSASGTVEFRIYKDGSGCRKRLL